VHGPSKVRNTSSQDAAAASTADSAAGGGEGALSRAEQQLRVAQLALQLMQEKRAAAEALAAAKCSTQQAASLPAEVLAGSSQECETAAAAGQKGVAAVSVPGEQLLPAAPFGCGAGDDCSSEVGDAAANTQQQRPQGASSCAAAAAADPAAGVLQLQPDVATASSLDGAAAAAAAAAAGAGSARAAAGAGAHGERYMQQGCSSKQWMLLQHGRQCIGVLMQYHGTLHITSISMCWLAAALLLSMQAPHVAHAVRRLLSFIYCSNQNKINLLPAALHGIKPKQSCCTGSLSFKRA
jgi:hypothetical protein